MSANEPAGEVAGREAEITNFFVIDPGSTREAIANDRFGTAVVELTASAVEGRGAGKTGSTYNPLSRNTQSQHKVSLIQSEGKEDTYVREGGGRMLINVRVASFSAADEAGLSELINAREL